MCGGQWLVYITGIVESHLLLMYMSVPILRSPTPLILARDEPDVQVET